MKKTQGPGVLCIGDVARMFGVEPRTVARWVRDGKLPSFRTPGGHRRFEAADIAKLRQDGEGRP